MIDEARQKVYRMQNPKKDAEQSAAKKRKNEMQSGGAFAGRADGSTRLFFFHNILYTLYKYNENEKQHKQQHKQQV